MSIIKVVEYVKVEGARKTLRLADGKELVVSKFARVKKGDRVLATKRYVDVMCKNGRTRIWPAYNKGTYLELGERRLHVRVKEIETDEELVGYQNLTRFHYRTGRPVGPVYPLVITCDSPLTLLVLGYIEVAGTLLLCAPRDRVLNVPATFDELSWEKWDKPTRGKYPHLVARISRTVVHPEYRGLGLARILVEHAIRATRDHWQVSALKPLFLEIIADMLKFVPFVTGAGMRYIGMTRGNVDVIGKEVRNLIRSGTWTSEGGSIVSLQKQIGRKLVKLMERSGVTIDDLESRLSMLATSLPPEEYFELHSLLRLPKPVYMIGLTRRASSFLQRRIEDLEIETPERVSLAAVDAHETPIRVEALGAVTHSVVAHTSKTMSVQQSFGIRPDELSMLIFDRVSFSVPSGAILLVYGASGSGKSVFLRILMGERVSERGVEVEGSVDMPDDARVGCFEPLDPTLPLVEQLGEDVPQALYALNIAGLAEAHLYLRRWHELSNGQQYRAMLAKLIDSRANVWVADEFLSTLDPVTACIVARSIRKHVKRLGVTLVVGAPHYGYWLRSLQPDIVLHMLAPWEYRVLEGSELIEFDTFERGG